MQVDPPYLDEAFAEFDLKEGSTAFPDLRPILGQEGIQPLSAEGLARFRRVLGRLSWHLMTDMDVALRFPSEELALPTHQSSVTLSSCEAELVALQSGVQEGISLLSTLGFALGRLYPWIDIIPQDGQVTWYDEPEVDDEDSMRASYLFPLVVKTNSLAVTMLLEAADLQRKSRHIEIKVYWLRELMDRKVLLLSHVPGTLNPADFFTTCLPTQKHLFYRNMNMLGFVKIDFSLISNIIGLHVDVVDNSFSKPTSCLSNRNCVLCGERLESFVLCEEPASSGDQKSFRHVTALTAQDSSGSCFGSCGVFLPAGAQMTEEDARLALSGLTRVDWATGQPRETPDGRVMRRDPPEARKIPVVHSGDPSRPGGSTEQAPVEQAPVESAPAEPASSSAGKAKATPGKNLFKNRENKRRQKQRWPEIQRASKAERTVPQPIYEIPAGERKFPIKTFFDPSTGRREVVELTPQSDQEGGRKSNFRHYATGFSAYPNTNRTCYQCGQKGHLSANCPNEVRRVSLTEGQIRYDLSGELRARLPLAPNMGVTPHGADEDDIRPEDSASQIGNPYHDLVYDLDLLAQ
eukprot:s793_g19.t1